MTLRIREKRLMFKMRSSQDDNKVERTFYPKDPNGESAPPVKGGGLHMKEGILSHHEVMHRLDIIEMERGQSISRIPNPVYVTQADSATFRD